MPRGRFLDKPLTDKVTKSGFFWFAAFLCVVAFGMKLTEQMTVSATADGRELPIYCVQTEEKKIGLSFDAAWGNDDTRKILEILKKHNVNVTFFMTGDWAAGCAYISLPQACRSETCLLNSKRCICYAVLFSNSSIRLSS